MIDSIAMPSSALGGAAVGTAAMADDPPGKIPRSWIGVPVRVAVALGVAVWVGGILGGDGEAADAFVRDIVPVAVAS